MFRAAEDFGYALPIRTAVCLDDVVQHQAERAIYDGYRILGPNWQELLIKDVNSTFEGLNFAFFGEPSSASEIPSEEPELLVGWGIVPWSVLLACTQHTAGSTWMDSATAPRSFKSSAHSHIVSDNAMRTPPLGVRYRLLVGVRSATETLAGRLAGLCCLHVGDNLGIKVGAG